MTKEKRGGYKLLGGKGWSGKIYECNITDGEGGKKEQIYKK